LKYQADPAAEVECEFSRCEGAFIEFTAAETNRPGIGEIESDEDTQKSGFSGPVGSEQRRPAASLETQVQVIERDEVPVTIANLFEFEYRVRHLPAEP